MPHVLCLLKEHMHARPGAVETHTIYCSTSFSGHSITSTAQNVRATSAPVQDHIWKLRAPQPDLNQFSLGTSYAHSTKQGCQAQRSVSPRDSAHTTSLQAHRSAPLVHHCLPTTMLGHDALHTAHNDARRSQARCSTSPLRTTVVQTQGKQQMWVHMRRSKPEGPQRQHLVYFMPGSVLQRTSPNRPLCRRTGKAGPR